MSATGIERVPKEYRPLVKAALDAGWSMSQSRHGHPKLTSPCGYSTPIPGSSSNPSLWHAISKRLRSHGVAVGKRK